jgi:hypothetical protein
MRPAEQWSQKEHHLSLAAPIDIVKPDAIDCYEEVSSTWSTRTLALLLRERWHREH